MAHPRHTSTQAGSAHPLVREYLDIKRNRSSAPDRAVAIEGLWGLRHALDAEAPVDAVFVCRDLVRGADTDRAVDCAASRGARILSVSAKVLRRLVDRDGPDGLAAIARLSTWSLAGLRLRDRSRIVVIDGLELPGNVGTIIRVADGAGATAVISTDRRVRMTHPTLVRASLGTVFTTPFVDVDARGFLEWARENRFRVIAASPDAERSYRDVDYDGRVALVVGSESNGLRPHWLHDADALVAIPMLGVADSLNVGHAAALLLYEALGHPPSDP